MIKHLPEGLVPFEDCRFSRVPFAPLEGEKVFVDCRSEEGVPVFHGNLNDKVMKNVPCSGIAEHHYRFELGSFEFGDRVSYWIENCAESTRVFTFDVQQEKTYRKPLHIFKGEKDVVLDFGAFEVRYADMDGMLYQTANTAGFDKGKPCEKSELELHSDFKIEFSLNFISKLKRLSNTLMTVDSFTVREKADGTITSVSQRGMLNASYVWGTGERFDHVNQRQHGSNGRVVEKFTHQGDQTYLPIPFFMTEKGFGWSGGGSIPIQLDFSNEFTMTRAVNGQQLFDDCLYFGTTKQMLSAFIKKTGKPVLPPEWAFGTWISANGWNCDDEVDAQLEALKTYDYPADVMVLEAWSDEQTFYLWNDTTHWKNPKETIEKIRAAGLHLVLWQIPILKYEWDGEPGERLLADCQEAIDKKYCIMNEDGTPYRITENWFHNSLLLDFTNPEAVKWWFDKRKYLLDLGVEGFKTDGGEFLFDHTAKLKNGMIGLEAHNAYPGQYIGAYHDFLQENGVNGVVFSRADSTGAQMRPIHWAGDQISTWEEFRAQLTAGLTAGLSGVLFWGFDIAGFAGDLPEAELYLRATAMACFSPVMQWHAEPRSGQFYATHEDGFVNDRSPWNMAEKTECENILPASVRFAKIRRAMRPYLYREAQYCVQSGRPLMAHLCLDFPEDQTACTCNDAYMLGRKLLVAPILEKGQTTRTVYLPKGRWKHCFNQNVYDGGREMQLNVPLDEIVVLERLDG